MSVFSIMDSGLFDNVTKVDNKVIGYKTGFTFFDIPTAHHDVNVDGYIEPNGGLYPRINTTIGESGTGKTTMMIQISGAVCDKYPGAQLMMIDIEGNTTPQRIRDLNHWDINEYKRKCIYIPPNDQIDINVIYNYVRKICHAKAKAGEAAMMDTPYRDAYTGKIIRIFIPTIVIVDSIPAINISKSEEERVNVKGEFKEVDKISSNMAAAHEAAANTYFLKKVKPDLAKYNVILININHLVKEMSLSMFDFPKKYHPNLKPGEKLKGGGEQIFQSFTIFKGTPRKAINERNPVYGDEIRGSFVSMELIKNKANVSATEYAVVFDKATGMKPELSDFELLFNAKFGTGGSPVATYLEILPEIKFSRKTLLKQCRKYPLLPRAIAFTAKYYLANKLITKYAFGELDLKRFALLPMDIRTNMILTMTNPYPGYVKGKFHSPEAYDDMMRASLRGSMLTGFGISQYISPANVNIAQKIISNEEGGYAFGEKLNFYDPGDPGRSSSTLMGVPHIKAFPKKKRIG